MANDGELGALLEYEDELLCVRCMASLAVGVPLALLCEECRAILTDAVSDWNDSPPSAASDRPAA